MIITIDGPSGTGKSTLAKALAEALQFNYCNTGAMYRTLAYARLQPDWQEVPLEDFLASPPISFSFSKNTPLQAFYKVLLAVCFPLTSGDNDDNFSF